MKSEFPFFFPWTRENVTRKANWKVYAGIFQLRVHNGCGVACGGKMPVHVNAE
jgi:hypothetical protein